MADRRLLIAEVNEMILERAKTAQTGVHGTPEVRVAQYTLSMSNSLLVIATVLNELFRMEVEMDEPPDRG